MGGRNPVNFATMLVYPGFNPIALRDRPDQDPLVRHHVPGGFRRRLVAGAAPRRAARLDLDGGDVDDFVFYAMLGVILGGRIGYVLFYGMPLWRGDWWYPLKIWEGGMSFHGGMLGVLVAIAIFARQRGRVAGTSSIFAAPLPGIGLFAGRIGNFINGELWGKPTDAPWGVKVGPGGGPIARHPSQLYEATLEGLVLFTIMWWFTSKPRPRLAPSGLFLVSYGTARILVEFVRVPDVHIGYLAGGWLTMGQLLSLPMLLAGLLLLRLPTGVKWRAASGNFTIAAAK